jgi:hypothetical protein
VWWPLNTLRRCDCSTRDMNRRHNKLTSSVQVCMKLLFNVPADEEVPLCVHCYATSTVSQDDINLAVLAGTRALSPPGMEACFNPDVLMKCIVLRCSMFVSLRVD